MDVVWIFSNNIIADLAILQFEKDLKSTLDFDLPTYIRYGDYILRWIP